MEIREIEGGIDQEFHFRHLEFDMPIGHQMEIKSAVEYLSLEFRREVCV